MFWASHFADLLIALFLYSFTEYVDRPLRLPSALARAPLCFLLEIQSFVRALLPFVDKLIDSYLDSSPL